MDPSTITPELIQQLIQTQQQQQAEIQALQVQNGQLTQQNQQLHQELINHQQTVGTAQQGTAGNSPPAAVKSNLKPKEPFTYAGSRKQLPDWLRTTERWLRLSRASEAEKCEAACQYLSCPLQRWYELENLRTPFQGWENFKERIGKKFKDPNAQTRLREEVRAMKCGNKTVQKYTDDFIEKAMQIEDVTEADLLHDYLRGLPTDIRLAVKRRGVTGLEAVMTVADEEDQLI